MLFSIFAKTILWFHLHYCFGGYSDMSVLKGKKQQIKKEIVTLLTQSVQSTLGLTQFQISEQLKVSRQTIKKYLDELVSERKIQAFAIGAYTLYYLPKNQDYTFYQVLYYGALRVSAYLTSSREWLNPELIEVAWGEIIDQITIPSEEEIPRLEKRPTPDLLERLLDVVCSMVNKLKFFNLIPNATILPPLGTQSPMTRLIRVQDPGLKDNGSAQHYYLISNLLQEKLTYKSGLPIIVRVAGEIQPENTEFYYEIGFVEQYFLDVCVTDLIDNTIDPRHYLDMIQTCFANFLKFTKREYMLGNTLHYELKFADNRQFEEFWGIRTKSLIKNFEIIQKLGIQSSRKHIPYEDWPDEHTLIIQLITNVGYTFDEYHRAAMKVFPHAGYNVHFEKIPNGLQINMLEEFDFEATFIIPTDQNSIREHYRKLGITSEEFFKERQHIYEEILGEMSAKRIQRIQRKKQHKRQNATLNI